MKSYDLGATDASQYRDLTEEEKEAWLNPEPGSYHSFHVERMGHDVFRWRNSRTATFCVGSFVDLSVALHSLQLRKINPEYKAYSQTIRVLSEDEVNDLLKDL
jgi:hypothetical protein